MNDQSTRSFVLAHRHDDVRQLALQMHRYPSVDRATALEQIAGWQTAVRKLPSWTKVDGLRYPPHLSLEQCSSEAAARYKAAVAGQVLGVGLTMVDLTGGLGVDCAFLAQLFGSATYVERDAHLCDLARHNFPLLGLKHIDVVQGDCLDVLPTLPRVDLLFLDPARRDAHGGRVVAMADCTPNVTAIEDLLLVHAQCVMVKLSPMLDLTLAMSQLHHVRQAHVVAVDGECRELLLVLGADNDDSGQALSVVSATQRSAPTAEDERPVDVDDIPITCVNLTTSAPSGRPLCFTHQPLCFTRGEERNSPCPIAAGLGTYLYEPSADILKAGAYRTVAHRFNLEKLHPSTHLYTSATLRPDFPGRRFQVQSIYPFNKAGLRSMRTAVPRAELTLRNFPSTTADLRRRLALPAGGDITLMATTLGDGSHVLVACHKA